MANSVDPDQMPHSAASDLSTLFAKAHLSHYLGLLQYLGTASNGGFNWLWGCHIFEV